MRSTSFVSACLLLVACGGSAPAPKEPEAESEKPAAAEDAKADEGKSDEKTDDSAKSDSSSSGPTITRTAKDIVTAPDTLFMFSFNESDVKQKAEDACEGRSKGDPKKRADCMSKEKGKIEADGIGFKQENGNWYYLTIRRKGKVLTNLHKVQFEWGAETPNSVVLKITGKDTGTKPGRFPSEVKIEVPNDYQIVLDDS